MSKVEEYRNQSVAELELAYTELSEELFHLRTEKASAGKLSKPHEKREARKNIARVLTVLDEKRGQQEESGE